VSQKIAFYGNNLNHGYFFVRNLARLGIEAKLFCIDYPYDQEHPWWWTDEKLDSNLVCSLKTKGFSLGTGRPLLTLSEIQELYDAVKQYDILMMMEDGPALFSELDGIKKIFFSAGGDLQLLPFLMDVYYKPEMIMRELLNNIKGIRRGGVRNSLRRSYSYLKTVLYSTRIQSRQRKGLHQCHAMICSPHQRELIRRLGLDLDMVHYLPFPMDGSVLSEVDEEEVAVLQRKYEGIDALFFHPTRQFYLRENHDPYLKDNDKLIYAYAKIVERTNRATRLLLLAKGREKDIACSQTLIEKLNLKNHVEWLPEMPGKKVRSYYRLPNVVVCDQFSPNLAILGNVGREASFYGLFTITAFAECNHLYYQDDWPPHVFPAHAVDEIVEGMLKVIGMNSAEKDALREKGVQWYSRNLDRDQLMPRFIDLYGKL
jgi:glycosyltransferase involved in cell wall biosynthesis